MSTWNCSEPGCDREIVDTTFRNEEALVEQGKPLTRKPLAVERIFSGKCPKHGDVLVTREGHHVSSGEAVGYEMREESAAITFAVRNKD